MSLLAAVAVATAASHPVAAQVAGRAESARADRHLGQGMSDRDCPQDQTFDVAFAASGERPHRLTPESLCVAVVSNGCTDRNSFDVSVREEQSITRVTLKRIRPDGCRMRSHRIWLVFSWQELGLDGPRAVVVEERTEP